MTTKNGINQLKDIFKKKNFQEEVDFETNMLALSFLSEVEKEADLKGIKRKELAKIVGTSPSYITQIMRGNKVPNLKILAALGLAIGKKFNIRAVECIQKSKKTKVDNKDFNSSHLDAIFDNVIDKRNKEIVESCLKENMSIDLIKRVTNLSKKEVIQIIERTQIKHVK